MDEVMILALVAIAPLWIAAAGALVGVAIVGLYKIGTAMLGNAQELQDVETKRQE